MHFTLHQLEILVKIIEKKSFTKASEELYMTQPAVSIQFKKFQEQFDIPLIEVINRKTHITDFGFEVGQAAKRILEEVEYIQSMSLAYKGLVTGRVKVMSVSTGKYVLPYMIGDFPQLFPGVEFQIDVTNKQIVSQALIDNTIDFGLVSVLPDSVALNYEDLMENNLFFVGASKFVSTKKQKSLTLLRELPIIYREPGSGTRIVMEEFLRSNELELPPKMELSSNEAVKQALLAGLGCSLMPEIGIQKELEFKKLFVLPIEGFPITTTWKLVWLKQKKLSPAAAAYLDYVKNHKDKLVSSMLDTVS